MALIFVLSKVDLKEILKLLASINPIMYGIGILCVFMGLAISGYRWYIFTEPKILSPLGAIFITLGALFYGMFLPAGAGVDLIRGLYLGVKSGSKSQSFASVFIDRMVGFLALLTLATMAMLMGSKTMRHIGGFIIFGLIISFTFSVVILSRRLRGIAINMFGGIGIFRIGERITRFLRSFDHYRENIYLVIFGFLISFVMQGFLGMGAYFIGVSIGTINPAFDLIFIKTVVYTSLVNLITMIPISIGGIGIREGGFVYLMGHYVGYEGAVLISVLYYLANIIASSPGLLFIWTAKLRP